MVGSVDLETVGQSENSLNYHAIRDVNLATLDLAINGCSLEIATPGTTVDPSELHGYDASNEHTDVWGARTTV